MRCILLSIGVALTDMLLTCSGPSSAVAGKLSITVVQTHMLQEGGGRSLQSVRVQICC